jgi:hypothetical protein
LHPDPDFSHPLLLEESCSRKRVTWHRTLGEVNLLFHLADSAQRIVVRPVALRSNVITLCSR